jgi:hypothetical protein
MNLSFKHLAPYLPYKLAIWDCVDNEKVEILGINQINNVIVLQYDVEEDVELNSDFKPILRPITDLNCDFEIDDCNVYNSLSARSRNDLNYSNPLLLKWSYEDIQILLKHHFDVFGLIEKGLAISIHDVEQADA